MEVNRNEYYKKISQIIFQNEHNKYCFDCKTPFPKYISINNAIFLCKHCSELHKALGVGISFIRSINEPWDDYLLLYIQRGGNKRLINHFEKYKIKEFDINIRYRTKASEYYRFLVNYI
jgi:hypothetical protein